uniref:Uncharacterized protein n=1 Tax=Setaria viridis TaxID=4556 RepID=A0A4U6TLE6_SETVI|nr:hypothetical protein SEVIR_9G544800v2 [Setaria viridis]
MLLQTDTRTGRVSEAPAESAQDEVTRCFRQGHVRGRGHRRQGPQSGAGYLGGEQDGGPRRRRGGGDTRAARAWGISRRVYVLRRRAGRICSGTGGVIASDKETTTSGGSAAHRREAVISDEAGRDGGGERAPDTRASPATPGPARTSSPSPLSARPGSVPAGLRSWRAQPTSLRHGRVLLRPLPHLPDLLPAPPYPYRQNAAALLCAGDGDHPDCCVRIIFISGHEMQQTACYTLLQF